MRLLFENWRKYIVERIDYEPPKKQPEFDVGTTFTKITVDGIINNKYANTMVKATIIEMLELFNKLHIETDISEMKIILKTIRTMSGNSEDFSFLQNYDEPSDIEIRRAKDKARWFYRTPDRLVAHPGDKKPTKSLKDWHDHLKVVRASPGLSGGWQDRSEEISKFYSSSDYYNPDSESVVDPHADTEKTEVAKARVTVRLGDD